jgi:hypothetical protein
MTQLPIDFSRGYANPQSQAAFERIAGVSFDGNCPDCLRGGIYSRISARKPALIGAGNAVSIPVAEFMGCRILEAAR